MWITALVLLNSSNLNPSNGATEVFCLQVSEAEKTARFLVSLVSWLVVRLFNLV